MKIVFIFVGFPRRPVGGCKIVYEYANRLSLRGHTVSVVHCRKVDGLKVRASIFKKIRSYLFFIYLRTIRPSPAWQAIEKNVRMLFVPSPHQRYIPDADIVFITSWPLLNYILTYSPAKGKKCYLFQHYETWSGPQDKVDACWQSALLYKVVISQWLCQIGRQLSAPKVRYIPNGIDRQLFRLSNSIEGRKKIITLMYSQHPWKGSEDGFKVLKELKSSIVDLEAVLFGVSACADELPDWIKFYEDPSQQQLVDIYNRSAVFLCTSHCEGFALPPAEAMACGCAVVTTDCGGIHDFATHQVNALIASVGDIKALAGHCQRLLEDDELRIELARAGHKSIERLDWNRSIDEMEGFLKQCCLEK